MHLLFICCSVPRRTLHCAARALRRQQGTDRDQRDLSPEDKPGSLNQADKFPPTCMTTAPPGDTFQVPSIAESTVTTHVASKLDAPLTATKSCLSFYPQPPLPGRSRVGGRVGVSFCFSRRGPRLEPSAPVFSDLEEEEREKREQMKERIKGIMEDICREIAEVEGRKCDNGGKHRSCSEGVGSCEAVPIPSGVSREEGDIEKGGMVKKPVPSGSCSSGLLLRPSQTQNTLWGTAPAAADIDIKHTDKESEKKQESERAWKESQDTCVLGKDGSTYVRWPATLLKFTKTQPRISYSHNPLLLSPQQTEILVDSIQEVVQKRLSPLSDSNPTILTPVIHTHLETHSREDLQSSRKEKVEHFETIQHVDGDKEHLCLKENLSSPETGLDKRRRAPIIKNSVRTASHPSDYSYSDSSTSNSQNPQRGRLVGVAEITERAITTISPKAESVTQTGSQGTCTSPSRCECRCERAITSQLCVGVSGVSHKSRKAGVKKQRLRKKNKIKKEKTTEESRCARRQVRSVVSTVSAGAWRVGESAEKWGMMKKRRKVHSAVTRCLLGKWEGKPVSVSVRKRRPHRSNSTESQSEAEREHREHCRASSQLGRHAADRSTMREGRPDRHAATVPWRSHISLHSFSSGCNSELFWERGHHSNPRSFIDCCYPDNSCGCSPPRKRKLLHRDRLFIHCKRRSLRHRDVWEETERARKTRGHSGSRNRGLNADAEQWDWMRGSCPRGLRAAKIEEWDQMARFSPSPSRWSRGSRQISTDDADWDRCSVDRWTWSSSDSGEDRSTHRSMSGSRTGGDRRGSSDSVEKCARTVHLRSKHLLNSEWWTSRQISSPQSVIKTQASRGCSPGSCSPCSSSTRVSELSWDWSRSSTCSGAAVDGSTVSPCRATSKTRGLSSKGQKEQNNADSYGTNNSSASSHRSCFTPAVQELNTHYSDPNPPQVKEPQTQCELQQGTPVTTARADGTPGLSPDKSRSQKSTRVLLLPLIGKLPAIQKKAERRKALLWKSQQKERENGAEGMGTGRDAREVTNSQAESNSRRTPSLSLSEIRTADKQAVGQTAPPISFTPEEMDKYRLLQEQAREHMQKVLEQMQDDADTHAQTNYTHRVQTAENCQTLEHYTHTNPPQPQIHPVHTDSGQTQPQHPLQVTPTLPHVTSHENFPEALALGPPSLPPLPPSASLRRLPHVILQHTAVSMPVSSPSTSTPSSSTPIHPHPAQLPHPPHPLHPSLPLPLHLSPFSISSLFPSILLSHSPIPLLPQSPAFHVTPVAPLSAVTLQPLTLQPFMDRAWPVRFQQKVL